jgi:hypothetical protein
MSEINKAIGEFVGAFEVVFRHDWKYTQEVSAYIKPGTTFVEPGGDEYDDWWARGILLEKYRNLLKVMKENSIELVVSDELQKVMTVFKDRHR